MAVAELPIACCRALDAPSLTADDVADLEIVFKALADETRIWMLHMLIAARDEAICVCDFQEALDLKQATASYHLRQLTGAGLIERERRGTFAHYRLRAGTLDTIRSLLGRSA